MNGPIRIGLCKGASEIEVSIHGEAWLIHLHPEVLIGKTVIRSL